MFHDPQNTNTYLDSQYNYFSVARLSTPFPHTLIIIITHSTAAALYRDELRPVMPSSPIPSLSLTSKHSCAALVLLPSLVCSFGIRKQLGVYVFVHVLCLCLSTVNELRRVKVYSAWSCVACSGEASELVQDLKMVLRSGVSAWSTGGFWAQYSGLRVCYTGEVVESFELIASHGVVSVEMMREVGRGVLTCAAFWYSFACG